jgi:hypothetical protein
MTTSEQTDKLYPALLKAHQAMGKLIKDSKNPHFKSSFASLVAVQETCIPTFNEAGIIVQQAAESSESGVSIVTRLIHAASSQWQESCLEVPVQKSDAQAVGSAISYGRRYSLQAIAGLAAEDDDGESAVGRGKQAALPDRGRAKTSAPKSTPPPSGPISDDRAVEIADLWAKLSVDGATQETQVSFVSNKRTKILSELTGNEADRLFHSLEAKASTIK